MPDFVHRFHRGPSPLTLLLLHGTGGDEDDLLPLGRALAPEASLLSPRGKVLENGMPRWFRRLAEGVFDVEDVERRAHELADWVEAKAAAERLDRARLVALGYSNGANVAAAVLLLRPEVLAGAVLLRAMVPLAARPAPGALDGKPVLVANGRLDPMIRAEGATALAEMLEAAGADVTLRFEPTGHGLVPGDVAAARAFLTRFA